MCLLIHRPAGAGTIPPAWVDDFWQRNSDGFGAWWIVNDPLPRIEIKRTQSKDEAKEIIAYIQRRDCQAGLHFRMATHGSVGGANTHPFVLTENGDRPLTTLAHNGVLPAWGEDRAKRGNYSVTSYASWNKDTQDYDYYSYDGVLLGPGEREQEKQVFVPSDTFNFVEKAMKPMVRGFGLRAFWTPDSPARQVLLELVTTDKLLLTNVHLGFSRVGAAAWTEWRGMQLSNTYAWSYTKRDQEDPSKLIPFVLGGSASGRGSGGGAGQSGTGSTQKNTNYDKDGYYTYLRERKSYQQTYADWLKEFRARSEASVAEEPPKLARNLLAEGDKLTELPLYNDDSASKPEVIPPAPATMTAAAMVEVSKAATTPLSDTGGGNEAELVEESGGEEKEAKAGAIEPDPEDVIIEALANMNDHDVAEWCASEPKEAAIIIKKLAWEYATDYEGADV